MSAEHHDVVVIGGGQAGLAIGTRQTPLPQQILGRDLFRLLTASHLMNATVDSRIGQRMKDRETLTRLAVH